MRSIELPRLRDQESEVVVAIPDQILVAEDEAGLSLVRTTRGSSKIGFTEK
jgi:hypothetical protein